MLALPRLVPFVLGAAALLCGCSVNPSTGRSQFILVSPAQVTAMGLEAQPGLIREYGGEVSSGELRSYVDSVGRRLAQHVEPEYEGFDWEFTTLNSDVVNAFALPGGKVFITAGLLSRFENEAEVAAVLGHEIGHVTARHVDERISQTLVAQLGMEILSASTDTQIITEGANLLAQGTLLKFGRDQESEADAQGLKYMVASGYDPRGMVQVLEVLAEEGAGARPPEILSSHPHPENRLRAVEAALAGPYRSAVGNPAYDLYRARFQQQAAPYLAGAR